MGLRVESFSITSRARIGDSTLTFPLEYSGALKRAGRLRLRAMGLLHVVYAGLIDGLRTRIDRFVTSNYGVTVRGHFFTFDEEILSRGRRAREAWLQGVLRVENVTLDLFNIC